MGKELVMPLEGLNVHKITENQRELVFTAATQTHRKTHTHTHKDSCEHKCVFIYLYSVFSGPEMGQIERRRVGGQTEMADADCE